MWSHTFFKKRYDREELQRNFWVPWVVKLLSLLRMNIYQLTVYSFAQTSLLFFITRDVICQPVRKEWLS